jgi:hypothetical protein
MRKALFAVLLGGCFIRTYDGPKTPARELVRLEKAADFTLLALDGEAPPASLLGRWALTPGAHTVAGSQGLLVSGGGAKTFEVEIAFEAKAGHYYQVLPMFGSVLQPVPAGNENPIAVRDRMTGECWFADGGPRECN